MRLDPQLNKEVWKQGIKGVPYRLRIRISRKRNDEEGAKHRLFSYVQAVNVKNPKGLHTVVVGYFPFLCQYQQIRVEVDGLCCCTGRRRINGSRWETGVSTIFHLCIQKKNANVYGVPSSPFGVIWVGVYLGVFFFFRRGILDGQTGIVEL